jgi:hypothetical protein
LQTKWKKSEPTKKEEREEVVRRPISRKEKDSDDTIDTSRTRKKVRKRKTLLEATTNLYDSTRRKEELKLDGGAVGFLHFHESTSPENSSKPQVKSVVRLSPFVRHETEISSLSSESPRISQPQLESHPAPNTLRDAQAVSVPEKPKRSWKSHPPEKGSEFKKETNANGLQPCACALPKAIEGTLDSPVQGNESKESEVFSSTSRNILFLTQYFSDEIKDRESEQFVHIRRHDL